MNVDFGRTAADYARYRVPFPDGLFERMAALGIVPPAEGGRALDLGTGTGALARALAARGWRVTGLDRSERMLEAARALGGEVEYRQGDAEETGLPGAAFDLVTAGTCGHWFDRPRAARECLRLLKPGGWLMLASLDWIPLPDNAVEATERLIRRHNPAWRLRADNCLYPDYLADLLLAGFAAAESFSFDVLIPFSHEAWRGRIRASAGVGASLGEAAIRRFDAELARLLEVNFAEQPLLLPHRVFAFLGRTG
jgi:SAM-dependent methyltransferase